MDYKAPTQESDFYSYFTNCDFLHLFQIQKTSQRTPTDVSGRLTLLSLCPSVWDFSAMLPTVSV
jgi:hypothetical protein